MKISASFFLVAAFSSAVLGRSIADGHGDHGFTAHGVVSRGPKPKPQPHSGNSVTDAGIANSDNVQGSSIDTINSDISNTLSTIKSGVFGSGAVNTGFANFNNKPPTDNGKNGKKSRDLEELLVRSVQGKLLARAVHDRLARFHSPGVHQLRDFEALYSRSINNIFARSDKPKPAHTGVTGAFDNIGAGVANFGNAQGSSLDAIVSGTTNAVGTLVSGVLGSGAVNTAFQNHNNKPANNGKKSRDFENLLVRSIILARSMHGVSSRSDKPKPQPIPTVPHSGVTGAPDSLGAGIANFGNAQGSGFDAILSGMFNSVGTLVSGTTGSGAVNTAFQNFNNKPADGGKKSRDLHDLLVRSIHDKLFLSSARP